MLEIQVWAGHHGCSGVQSASHGQLPLESTEMRAAWFPNPASAWINVDQRRPCAKDTMMITDTRHRFRHFRRTDRPDRHKSLLQTPRRECRDREGSVGGVAHCLEKIRLLCSVRGGIEGRYEDLEKISDVQAYPEIVGGVQGGCPERCFFGRYRPRDLQALHLPRSFPGIVP